MTREEFISSIEHELNGHLLDAIVNERKGASLSLWLKAASGSLRAKLGAAYDAIVPPEPVRAAPPVRP